MSRIAALEIKNVPGELAAQGEGIKNIVIGRVTQHNETDLAFLNRIGKEYGYVFSIRGNQLIFISIFTIESNAPVAELDKTDLLNWSITDKTLQTYKQVNVKYHNPENKTVSEYKVSNDFNPIFPLLDKPFQSTNSNDTLNIHTKAENNQQAEEKAKVALYRANSLQQEGNISTPGNPYLCAGVNFDLTGLGKISGTFHIMSSTHRVDRSGGWTIDAEIKRVGFIIKTKTKSTKKRKPQKYTVEIVD
jgi:phage protein D